jgi:dTDP-4-dehydrorhamnose 3,5-epimerase
MKITKTALPGVVIIEPKVFEDSRGTFMEGWHRARYEELGLPGVFVQDNSSFSKKGVLRGLHFQHPQAQGKLVSVLQGEVFDVAVDIRVGSPTYRQWVGITLSADNKRQLYIPEGFAHGFCVTSETALFMYKCTDYYHPATETGLLWNDPDIGIAWPIAKPILSDKDRNNLRLCDIPPEKLPRWGGCNNGC